MITHAVGLSLAANSASDSGVAVRELASGKIILLDKLYSMRDIELFFENYNNLKNSIVTISLPWDNAMLDGKWRVLSKPYQMLNENNMFLNKNNWMQRYSPRGSEFFLELKAKSAFINRFEIYLTRQKLNLYSNYKERSSADCKFLQEILKTEYGFNELPNNMIPASQLEGIVGTILSEKFLKLETENIFEFKNINVINIK
ncbi:hypothetical protein IJO12_03315 [bacterium]|nr:hypothetical protein [bacterium]